MPDKVFSSELADVAIYLDDGTGAPAGAALFTFTYMRAASAMSQSRPERIPHMGYPDDEVAPGKRTYVLDLGRALDNRDRDLQLSDALYYVTVALRTDDWSQWDRYVFKKCRPSEWRMPQTDIGVVNVRARLIPESMEKEAAS